MKRLAQPKYIVSPYVVVALLYAIYVAIFAYFQDQMGIEIASLAILPVIAASWYFGVKGGLLLAGLSLLTSTIILTIQGYTDTLIQNPGNWIGGLTLVITAILFGWLSAVSRERREALIKLEQYEKERDLHATFLEKLDLITALALEPDDLQTTLEILTEQLAGLFQADNAFFTFWDADREGTLPAAAYGSMRESYPSVRFEPGEVTLTASVMKAEYPIPVSDIQDSPYLSPRAAAIYPSHSMLGIPLITQQHKLGAILLGYQEEHTFTSEELYQAQITSEQMALVLSKLQLLEEERRQVRQLTALHDVALTSIQVDNEDQLIERVTDIIGHNLFPDNFGIMLVDEEGGFLQPHSSYRFYKTEKPDLKELTIEKGITGQVAMTGQPQRVGDVRGLEYYIDMDESTISELCVPIKFKERILGIINAESKKQNAFSEEDERLLVTLAGQLATAIEQLRREQAERKWFNQLAHSNDLIYSIAHITTQIDRSQSEVETIQALGSELKGIDLTCIMALYNSHLKTFTVNYSSLPPQFLDVVEVGLGYPLLQYTFPRNRLEVVLGGNELLRPMVVTHPEEEINAIFTPINRQGIARILDRIGVAGETEVIRLPLVFEESLLGILWIWGKRITRSDLPILSILAKQIGISLERARLFEEVQSLALTDPLTGLHNRRSIFELGRIEFARARRMDHPFSCLMLDLDHFKRINDRYGHQIGDQTLQGFAARCLESVREGDLVGRYGGEELIILMPETDREMAVRVADRLRAKIAEKAYQVPDGETHVTVSIGVAAQDENTPHLEALIARADQALYISKHKGRNQVAVSK